MDITSDPIPPGDAPRGGAGALLPSRMTISSTAHRVDEVARTAMPPTTTSWPSWSSLRITCSQILTSGASRALELFNPRGHTPPPPSKTRIPTFEEYIAHGGSEDRDLEAMYFPEAALVPNPPTDPRIKNLLVPLQEEFPGIYHDASPTVVGFCPESDYPGLFGSLDLLCKGASSKVERAIFPSDTSTLPSKKIPKLLSFIWMGGNLPAKFRANVAHYADVMKAQGGEVVLWTDQTEVDEETRSFLSSHQIRLVPIASVFSSRESMDLFVPFRSAYSRVPPNYGEASDLLRYEIIDRFGGYYLDCDIEPAEFDLAHVLKKGENAPYGFMTSFSLDDPKELAQSKTYYEKWLRPPSNDNFGSVTKSAFIRNLKKQISKRYLVPTILISNGDRNEMVQETLFRSGPLCFSRAAAVTIAEENLSHPEISNREKDRLIERTFYQRKITSSAFSWSNSPLKPRLIRFGSDEERIERIKHSISQALIYDAESLNLELYRPYLKEGEEALLIEFVERTLEAHPELFSKVNRIFIKDLDLLVRLKTKLETKFGHIEWNQTAMLKFACMVGSDSLIDYFIDTQHIDPFTADEESRVPGYDCVPNSPIQILIERKNFKVIEKIVLRSDTKKWTYYSSTLSYIGYTSSASPLKDLPKNLAIFYRELQKKHPVGTEEYLRLEAEAKAYDALQVLIDTKLRRSES